MLTSSSGYPAEPTSVSASSDDIPVPIGGTLRGCDSLPCSGINGKSGGSRCVSFGDAERLVGGARPKGHAERVSRRIEPIEEARCQCFSAAGL